MWSIIICLLIFVAGVQSEIIHWPPAAPDARMSRRVHARRYSSSRKVRRDHSLSACRTANELVHDRGREVLTASITPEWVAGQIEKELISIEYRTDEIVVLTGTDGEYSIKTSGGVLVDQFRYYNNEVSAAALMNLNGPFSLGWPALLKEIGRNEVEERARQIVESEDLDWRTVYAATDTLGDIVPQGMRLCDPDVLYDARWRLAHSIRQMVRPAHLVQLRLFSHWVKSPYQAREILRLIQSWEFDARELSDTEFQTVSAYVSIIRDPIHYLDGEFEPQLHALTVPDMREDISQYERFFDSAYKRFENDIER